MTVFISGGCKNGKSTYAEHIAAALSDAAKPLYYIATMQPVDDEDRARIKRHRSGRAALNFETVEISRDIDKLLATCDRNGTFLLDSTTALLANEMFSADGTVHAGAGSKIADEIIRLFSAVANIVVVSDYIYSDAAVYDTYTEEYRRNLALIDRRCAQACDAAIEVCYTHRIVHKGARQLEGLYEKNI